MDRAERRRQERKMRQRDRSTGPAKLAAMDAIGKKRYRVEIAFQQIHAFTVWGNDENDALEQVRLGNGHPAGVTQAEPVGHRAVEMGKKPTSTESAVMDNAETEETSGQSSIIEVVKS